MCNNAGIKLNTRVFPPIAFSKIKIYRNARYIGSMTRLFVPLV